MNYSISDTHLQQAELTFQSKSLRVSTPLLVGYKIPFSDYTNCCIMAGPDFNYYLINNQSIVYFHTFGTGKYTDINLQKDRLKTGFTTGIELNIRTINLSARYHFLSNVNHLYYQGFKTDHELSSNFICFGFGIKVSQNPKF